MSYYFIFIFVLATLPFAAHAQVRQSSEVSAQSYGCYECHGIMRDSVGPSFRRIAQLYKGDDTASDRLFDVVKNGGKGNWTEARGVPMPPYSGQLTDDEIRALIDWVMTQAK